MFDTLTGISMIGDELNRALALLKNFLLINDYSNLPDDLIQLTINILKDAPILQIHYSKLPPSLNTEKASTRIIGTEF